MPKVDSVNRGRGVVPFVGLCLLAGILVAGTVAPAAIGAGLLSNQVSDSVDAISAQLAAADPPLTTTVTDRDGTPIATLWAQYRLPVTSAGIATTMKAAIIGIEDRRFYTEGGVDMQGTLRAAVNDTAGGALQGASTITQQYVKNYLVNVVDRTNPIAQEEDREDSLARKLREAKMAVQLNNTTSKDDILANYLNVVEFSGTVYGVGAAAKAYFGTTPDKLTVPQAALLAGMVNNPSVYNPYTHADRALQRREPGHRRHGLQRLPPGVLRPDGEGGAARAAAGRPRSRRPGPAWARRRTRGSSAPTRRTTWCTPGSPRTSWPPVGTPSRPPSTRASRR